MTPRLVAEPDQVTPEWLTEVLREAGAIGEGTTAVSLEWQPIGTGQVGDNVRYRLAYEGPPGPGSVVCKFGSRDPSSAAAAVQLALYETEVAFYRELAPTVDVGCPRCYFAAAAHGTADAVVVMEDLAPAVQGDQIEGCTVAQAELAIDEAAKLHGPRWGDPTLRELSWLGRNQGGSLGQAMPFVWDGFVDRYRDRLDPVTLEAGAELADLVTSVDSRGGRAHCHPLRLPARQHALRHRVGRSPAHRRRLADGAARAGAPRRCLFPRQRIRCGDPPQLRA